MKIRVITFNLPYDKPDLGNCAWKVRKDAVASLITAYAPHLIGTQEGKAHQILDLSKITRMIIWRDSVIWGCNSDIVKLIMRAIKCIVALTARRWGL